MPRLRKLSAEQRRRAQAESLRKYREKNYDIDRIKNRLCLAVRRQNEEYRESEKRWARHYNKLRNSRRSSQALDACRDRNALNQAKRRSNPAKRALEQARNTAARALRRKDPKFREIEQRRDTLAHANRRSDRLARAKEQERNTIEHSLRRQNPKIREAERERDALAHANRRSDPLVRAVEQEWNTLEHALRREILKTI